MTAGDKILACRVEEARGGFAIARAVAEPPSLAPVPEGKISGGKRGDEGLRCRDTFSSIIKTLRKHGISFRDYLGSRFHMPGPAVPPVGDIIRPPSSNRLPPAGLTPPTVTIPPPPHRFRLPTLNRCSRTMGRTLRLPRNNAIG